MEAIALSTRCIPSNMCVVLFMKWEWDQKCKSLSLGSSAATPVGSRFSICLCHVNG